MTQTNTIVMHNHLPAMALRLLLITSTLTYAGCMQQPKPPQQGDVVLWKHNPQLIIKAKLGQRREHIVDTHCPACERDFYRPEQERYVGQFAIDYVPKKYPPISPAEAETATPIYVDRPLEFSLMLNGSTAKATDESIFNTKKGLDHIDQVKVVVEPRPRDGSRFTSWTHFRNSIDSGLVKLGRHSYEKYGLECVEHKDIGFYCYGQSSYDSSSGVRIVDFGERFVKCDIEGPMNGVVRITWLMDKSNIQYWQKVDSAIWRLLGLWHVVLAQ